VLEIADAAPDGTDGDHQAQGEEQHGRGTWPMSEFENKTPHDESDGDAEENGESLAEGLILVEEGACPPCINHGEDKSD